MIEMMAVITILGIVLFLTLPNLTSNKGTAELNAAKTKAIQLNIAKDAFIANRGLTSAQTSWSSATDDSARYLLLRPYLPPPAAASLSSFALAGYVLAFTPTGGTADPITYPVRLYQDINLNGAANNAEPEIPYQ
jgi:type II secretory pathway pseudopilin PulG